MKILLETIFGIVFIGIIIACLPTIMGLFSLCVIAYFIYQAAKSLFGDETENADAGHDGWEQDSKQDRSAEWQSVQDKQKSETERKQGLLLFHTLVASLVKSTPLKLSYTVV